MRSDYFHKIAQISLTLLILDKRRAIIRHEHYRMNRSQSDELHEIKIAHSDKPGMGDFYFVFDAAYSFQPVVSRLPVTKSA